MASVMKRELFFILSFFMALASKTGNAQSSNQERNSNEVRNSWIKISEPRESFYAELQGFSWGTNWIWTPFCVIKPTVKINNLSMGITTTQMLQNYLTENNQSMAPIMHDLYGHAEYQLLNLKVFANLGYFSPMNYVGGVAKLMPMWCFFDVAILGHSGHYTSAGGMVGAGNKQVSGAVGYCEFNDAKLNFKGGGDFVAVFEMYFGEGKGKIGTLWMVNKDKNKYVGDLQFVYNPNKQSSVFLEILNINHPDCIIHMIYSHDINQKYICSVNAYWQQGDNGISGAQIVFRDKETGVGLSAGATNNTLLAGIGNTVFVVGMELSCSTK